MVSNKGITLVELTDEVTCAEYTNNKRDSILGFSAETMLLDLLQFEL